MRHSAPRYDRRDAGPLTFRWARLIRSQTRRKTQGAIGRGVGVPRARSLHSQHACCRRGASGISLRSMRGFCSPARRRLRVLRQPMEAPDPRCPPKVPADGAPCSPDGGLLLCEYGGNSWEECTTLAVCGGQQSLDASGTLGPFQFSVAPGQYCRANIAACPATYAQAKSLRLCPSSSLQCVYDEGVCACSCTDWSCRDRSDVPTDVDGTSQLSSLPACPLHRPLYGDACPVEGQRCDYTKPGCNLEPSLGPTLGCLRGFWEYPSNWGVDCPNTVCP